MGGGSPDSIENQQRRGGKDPEREPGQSHQPVAYEKYVDFFENAAVPMHWVGPHGTILHANQAELDALGYSREEYVGHHIAEFHADQDVIDDILNRLSAGEELQDYEARMERKDGSIRDVLIDSSVNWQDGEFVNTRCVTRDTTDRKERRRRLQRERDRLDEFASVISHDLRNPLQAAEGNLQLAIEYGDLEALDGVAQALDRMDTLIEDLLTLANAGKSVGETESLELSIQAETCWRNVETAPAALETDAESSIPADETRLQQLLENLFRNAVEHGGEVLTVTVGDSSKGFYVEDDGTGIPPGERDNVFDAGYSTRADGTGFGLNIVRDIAEAHGWNITVTEGSDGGARFEISGVGTD